MVWTGDEKRKVLRRKGLVEMRVGGTKVRVGERAKENLREEELEDDEYANRAGWRHLARITSQIRGR